jgi:hypothetical protein
VETAKIRFKWWFVQHKEWSMVEVAISSRFLVENDSFITSGLHVNNAYRLLQLRDLV